jgi:hypothetical protein
LPEVLGSMSGSGNNQEAGSKYISTAKTKGIYLNAKDCNLECR